MSSLKIWVCEDDESAWEAQKEVLEDEFPGCRLKHFENAGYAAQATGSPDFIIVDVDGITGFDCDFVSLTRHNVEGLAELHPGAVFIVFSTAEDWAKDVYEALEPKVQACSDWLEGCDFYPTVYNTIKKWL